ncbi:MAG: pyruvate carboxylase subunit B [Desulfitobacteriaceae bacterium]|nr:pyruvate carboxylase subunit B [Desulfitobacteriaceae bacterium]MDD4345396.1 pyruvate carboxylase subunit B [Desulfitobacteriaceae bacterium]MDD4401491.1 pyruvate carboxylase subunit B [Desulfitobacteriaceae bacterium]
MRKINFTETVLRDGNQSLIATRMKFEQFAPILEEIDKVGYNSIEMWGGATYDSCIRFLNEDPWERLRRIKAVVKNTKLQMLLRGQNVLGYKHYPDEFVRKFIDHAIETGIDIVRVFDALNDLQNIRVAMEEVVKQGAHAQGTIVYTVSPIHDIKNYEGLAKQIEEMGASSICIKDMAGLLMPSVAYELVKNLKSTVKIPIQLHCHCANGIAEMAYWEAIRAGVDGIDCAISAFSSGSSQPPTEAFNFALKEAGYETGLDPVRLKAVNDFFKPLKAEFISTGLLDTSVLTPQPEGLVYQIPGGMLTNLISQLKNQNAIDKLDAVLNEVPRVRKDLGYPPLVTPTSQIVGTQAVMNILGGEPYKMIIKEVINYFMGEYGHVPGPINPDVAKKALRKKVPIPGRYADTLEPVFDATKEQLKDITSNDEDVLTYLMFPQVAEEFIKNKNNIA